MKPQKSITRRLRTNALMICVAVLTVACVLLFAFQLYTFRRSFIANASALAKSYAENSSFILEAEDARAAEATLTPLDKQPHIATTAYLLPNGRIFFATGRADYLSLPEVQQLDQGHVFSGLTLVVKEPVAKNGETFGSLVLVLDFKTELIRQVKVLGLLMLGALCFSLLIAYKLSLRFQRIIAEPLQALSAAANHVAEKRDYTHRAEKIDDDEFGVVTDAFNQMLHQIHTQARALQVAHEFQSEQLDQLRHEIAERQRAERELADTHRALIETSRQAGMAEVATGVLHNVGNVLNSVNVSVNCITDLVANSKITRLSKLTDLLPRTPDELAEFIRGDKKGMVLPSYLPQLGTWLADEFAQIAKEAGLLGKNVEHIKDIISRQQTYAKISGLIEPHDIRNLIEDALELNADMFSRHSIQIIKRYDRVPRVAADKHKVLQILINLLQNAKHAVADSTDRRVTLSISMSGDNVLVAITDTGCGIEWENLTKVFTHGFTTRKDGHGFGLHSGANAAREMGGNLTAHSDGPGKGATFTLTLPLAASVPGTAPTPAPTAPNPPLPAPAETR